ncbi:MAG: HlyD family type I secretion periplasmic adaptor subunit [Alphaproteobacteria bacterium]|nr:HlyD family type I secretion periplasmic adaptor subunit [Alphaproteobacteria bacterium]
MALRRFFEEDLDFAQPRVAALHRRGQSFAYILTILVAAFVLIFLIWASLASLDEVTRGAGKVIPSSRIQVVQNLEGGILSEILVQEGDRVDKGDVRVRIDNVLAETSYEEAKTRYLSLLASIARLEAELEGRDQVQFPPRVLEDAPDIAADQRAELQARISQYQSELNVLRSQASQKNQEIQELISRRDQLQSGVDLAKEELEITGPLVEKGIVSRLDLLRVREKVSNLEGELRTVKAGIPRARLAYEEAQGRIESFEREREAQIARELSEKRSELQSIAPRVSAGEDRVVRTDVKSPVRGTVKELKQNTVGGVIQPGQDIVEIVPINDTLLIEARIRPSDIAFIRPGQDATIKITAYDFSIYGGLQAKLERISADTIQDEEGNEFYRIYLRTEKNALERNETQLPIIPGMTANVEILTGEKTVLAYLLKPLLKARDEALRER